MTANTENVVLNTKTNQDSSHIVHIVDQLKDEEPASADEALASARKHLKKHLPAFEELAR